MVKTVLECVENCRLNNFNSRKGLRHLLEIPKDVDLDNLQEEILKCYTYFYIEKHRKIENETKEVRINRYLNPNIDTEIYDKRPLDYTKDKYRMLINIKRQWLKKTLKKINKILSASLIEKEKKIIVYNIPYLHSSVKKRSYETNAKKHRHNDYILAIDIQNFYPSIKNDKVWKFFRYKLHLDSDIAKIYSILCTCPLDDPIEIDDFDYGIGQGLATSPILAYLINHKMFDYMYQKSLEYGIEMTVYVDDVVFSSSSKIPQEFINALFGIVKSYNMNIKKEKVKKYNPDKTKKITGIYITNTNKIRVANSKHEETFIQYQYLLSHITKIKNADDYFYIYNLYIRFKGNIQFIKLVEEKIPKKYGDFLKEYNTYFIAGIKKKSKRFMYSKDNVEKDDYIRIINKYEKLRKYIDKKPES